MLAHFWLLGILLSGGPASLVAGPALAEAVTVQDSAEAIIVRTRGYEAHIDRPMGNLRAVYLDGMQRILGADTGMVQGVTAVWNDTAGATHVQSDYRAGQAPRILVEDNRVFVDHPAFRQEYRFTAQAIDIVVDVRSTSLLRGNDFHLYVGTEVIPPNRQINDNNQPTYSELGLRGYTSDFSSSQSSGVLSLVSFQARDANDQRFATIQLPGDATWYRSTGHVWVDRGPAEKVGPAPPAGITHWEGGHFLNNEGFPPVDKNPKGDDVIIVHGAHGYQAGDRLHKVIRFDQRGYDVRPLAYPVRTDNETNEGLAHGRIVVPRYAPPAEGYRLLIANHGNTGNAYDNTFMWDFLANEGYIVAASNYTSNAGPNHRDTDLGYNQQVEIEDLRRHVLAHYPIDRDRQYVAGLSLGGLNTFLAGINHPDVYAAMVPQSPVWDARIVRLFGLGPDTDTYAFRAGNPSERSDQLRIPTMVICGTNDLDALLLANSYQAKREHPEIDYRIVPNAGHELWTWEAYRKEVLRFFEENPRSPTREGSLDGRFVGAVTGQTRGYRDNGLRLDHENDWLSVGPLRNDTFTRITATNFGDMPSIRLDQDATVRIVVPANATARVQDHDGHAVAVRSERAHLDGAERAVVAFDAQAGRTYTAAFTPLEDRADGPVRSVAASPAVAALLAFTLAIFWRKRA